MPILTIGNQTFEVLINSDRKRKGHREIRVSPPGVNDYRTVHEHFKNWPKICNINCRKTTFKIEDSEIKVDAISLRRKHYTERGHPHIEYSAGEGETVRCTRKWSPELPIETQELTLEEIRTEILNHPLSAWAEPFQICIRCRS